MRLFAPILAVAMGLAATACDRLRDQDQLDNAAEVSAGAEPDAARRCAASATYDKIELELFRQAARVRGRDAAAFDRLAAYSVVRMERPLLGGGDEALDAIRCTGRLSLDLPPGVEVVGGRRTLTADIGYTIQPAADGSGEVILLTGADAIVIPLATLARSAPPPPPIADDPLAPTDDAPPIDRAPVASGPSFDCARARSQGERAVCANPNLAELDRLMARLYVRTLESADPDTRRALQRSRDRFLAYRERCPDDACIAEAYRGRMREISDIMRGR